MDRFLADTHSGSDHNADTDTHADSHTDVTDGTAKTDIIDMRGRTGQHHGNAQRAGSNRSWLTAQQWTTEPWQQQQLA